MDVAFWHISAQALLDKLHSSPRGLKSREAARRLKKVGKNQLAETRGHTLCALFLSQFKSPLVLLLLGAALLSFSLNDKMDALIILLIVFASSLLSFLQERGAMRAVEKLAALVKVKVLVIREGNKVEVDLEQIVPGDLVLLSAGDIVPGDCRLLESKECYVNEAALTGESFLVEKKESLLGANTPMRERSNVLFMGSNVMSGMAQALVVFTGRQTEFGKVSEHLRRPPPETSFEKGIRLFGYLLLEVTMVLVIAIFACNVYLQRPVLESFLFALALAVGLTPQLLPAIISINLAHGAKRMAKKEVIVKRLSSIENIGSMNVLCVDKTGTLTYGVIELSQASDPHTLLLAHLNAFFQTGYDNPIDKAILAKEKIDLSAYCKLDELPYDFIRKRLTILAKGPEGVLAITKGSFSSVLTICHPVPSGIKEQFAAFCAQGYRVLAVASKSLTKESLSLEDEVDFTFAGFLLFFDPLKEGVKQTLAQMKQAKVDVKIVTGDHHLVAQHIAEQLDLFPLTILSGEQIHKMSDGVLEHVVSSTTIFAELEPNQKERIVQALRKSGQIVGFLGDGINDATALHEADVGISVNTAADVAKEGADMILLQKDLSILLEGIREGRRTFANTMKYIFMATSANFGNMFSMAGASIFLPFLPLLPKQILLMNLFTDCPEMLIATDRVDPEIVDHPVRWDLRFISKFMILFGLISSFFDFITFGILLYVMKAPMEMFRTGWFIESVVSASIIVLVVRTKKAFFISRPSRYLTGAVSAIVLFTLVFPFTSLASLFGFVPLPTRFYWSIALIVFLYILSAEFAKKLFFALSKKANSLNVSKL